MDNSNFPPGWDAERVEVYLLMSQAYKALGDCQAARNQGILAVCGNPNHREAIEHFASLCYPKQKARWLEIASTADNSDALFVRSNGGSHGR